MAKLTAQNLCVFESNATIDTSEVHGNVCTNLKLWTKVLHVHGTAQTKTIGHDNLKSGQSAKRLFI